MTQLYVGNLSADGDEKAIRALFGKYGAVREVLMKNGYAFVEYESSFAAEEAIRSLNGSDILGHPMIVEPSHQQRLSSRRKNQYGRVEVTLIPPHLSFQQIETILAQVGQVLKMEIEEGDFGMKRIVATFETQEQAARAVATFKGDEHTPRVTFLEASMNGMRNGRKGSPSIPSSPSKNNSDFPLRILVPSDMVGAIIGKDGATIRMITQITKARVDVHRRENLGSAEKAITIIGPPECCTEACYQIMKIMQNELLMTSGMLENGKYHEPLPVVPLKILAHNELVGRVIGKGGNTLKRIMAESGTKITISKLKDLTAYNMERTITILGTIDNCKKAESLISAKLRASYESDMAQFIPNQYQHHTLSPSPTSPGPLTPELPMATRIHPQSLPATPTATNVRTFTDFSGEHTRLTTLHGSTGALEVNNLGGFKLGPTATNGQMTRQVNGQTNGVNFPTFETTIDGYVKTNGFTSGQEFTPALVIPKAIMAQASDIDDEISDVFSGLSMKDPLVATPGYGRGRNRRCSAPVNGTHNIWGNEHLMENGASEDNLSLLGSRAFGSATIAPSFPSWNPVTTAPAFSQSNTASSIWTSTLQGSRPDSQTSSYSGGSEHSSVSAFSPVLSPVPTTMNGFFVPESSSGTLLTTASLPTTPLTSAPLTAASFTEEQQRPAFKVSVPTTLTTVAESNYTMSFTKSTISEEEDLLTTATSTALELIGENGPLPSTDGLLQW